MQAKFEEDNSKLAEKNSNVEGGKTGWLFRDTDFRAKWCDRRAKGEYGPHVSINEGDIVGVELVTYRDKSGNHIFPVIFEELCLSLNG